MIRNSAPLLVCYAQGAEIFVRGLIFLRPSDHDGNITAANKLESAPDYKNPGHASAS